MNQKMTRRLTAAALLAMLAGTAQAHTGYATTSFLEGLVHPFGLDHMLAMVAVGVWSASALPPGKVWRGPAAFMLALLVSAVLGASGLTLPYLEHAIALSVVLFGAILVFATRSMPASMGLALVVVSSSLHGLAHGAETPETGFIGYATGFLLTTAGLHAVGVIAGLGIGRGVPQRAGLALGSFGAAMGVAGLYLFGQLTA